MCAIFGIAHRKEAAKFASLGLHALQHRGQEGAGIVSTDGKRAFIHKKKGLVSKVFSDHTFSELKGMSALGHTRYSTTGEDTPVNLQPLLMNSAIGWISMVHNGNLVNAATLTESLEADGAIFQTTNDTEVIIHLMARSGERDFAQALVSALKHVDGAYSIVAMNHEKLVAVRDPVGWRPLVMGELDGSPVFASETCALDLIGAEYKREVKPGEMIVVPLHSRPVLQSSYPLQQKKSQRCIFEYIYFARPDSYVFGSNVHEVRKKLGRQLAQEHPAKNAQLVIPVPDSGVPAAIGYAEAASIPFDLGIIRSHYVGRTFIEPSQHIRHLGVKLKLSPVKEAIRGKSIVVVDDSLVRGTTSKKLIQALRDAGAREIHLRISAPPTTHPCFYGIDTPTKQELMASEHSIEEIRQYIGADSLGYLTLNGLLDAVSDGRNGFCHACFSGDYPTAVPQ